MRQSRRIERRKREGNPEDRRLSRTQYALTTLLDWRVWIIFAYFAFIVLGVTGFIANRNRSADNRARIADNRATLQEVKAVQEDLRATVRQVRRVQAAEQATLMRLCGAAGQLADFWVTVRASTLKSLSDPTLSPEQRQSNVEFVRELTKGIHRARLVARCHP